MTATAPMPDLAQLNPAEVWLASIRRQQDAGVPLAEADEQADFRSTT